MRLLDKLATNEQGTLRKWFSVASIAEALDVHEDTILRKIHAREIKAIRWGGAIRVSEDELERFMYQNRIRGDIEKDSGEVVGDAVVEDYIYRDCKIEILRSNRSKAFFALSSLPGEGISGRPIEVDSKSIEELKRAAEAYVDKRIVWQGMRRQRKSPMPK